MYDITKFNPKNPKFVVYILDPLNGYDNFMNIIKKFNSVGINAIILSFIFYDNSDLSKPNLDQAINEWCNFTDVQRQNLKNTFNGVIIVSHGGSVGTEYIKNYNSYGYDKVSQASWNFVKKYNLDGLDIDYEHSALCDDTYNLTISLANIKPDNYLITMAPEMSDCKNADSLNSCWICHVNIYNKIPDKIDWFNLQYYNQSMNFLTNYNYMMIDSTIDENYQISLKEIITGKKFRNDADKNNIHCAYQYSRPPPNPLPCPDINPIPSYKLVIGSCVQAPSGCNSVTPTIAADYIRKAYADPNFEKIWFNGGGLMIWLYKSNEDFSYQYNTEIFDSINTILPLFSKTSGPDPTPTPGPNPTPTPGPDPDPTPINKCQNINCNKYGICDENTGKCVCNYGYNGNNCEKLPICNKELKNIKDGINNMKDKFSSTNLTIGIVLICIAILIFVFYIFYKIMKIFIGGIILFIVGLILISYYGANKNYGWNTSQWSNCNNNKQTRIVTCIDKNKNISSDTNCISPKPISQQDCNKTVTMCNCGSNYTCLQKNGQEGKKDDNLCVECQK